MATVALTGATGFVGGHMVGALLAKGHKVRALVRERGDAPRLPRGADGTIACEVVVGDSADPAAAADLVAGADACINLVGIIREVRRLGRTFQRAHVETPRVLTGACAAKGVRRFLHMSAMNARDVGVSEYQHTKFEGERIVRRSGLDWTIFRPSMIMGEGSEFLAMAKGWMSGHAQPWVFIPYFTGGREDTRVPLGGVTPTDPVVAPVDVRDVCAAFVRAMDEPRSVGEVYNLCGPEAMSMPAMLKFMRDNTPGAMRGKPVWGIPADAAATQAMVAGALGLGQMLPFDAGMARMAAEDTVADTTKAREDLGWSPRPFTRTYREYAGEGH
ncbi:MAG TPA: NAD(P)H-binding protein [Tepidisphaeraceae bacterium]|nr:NAD(P)H-binding protein [Tepidisphaeraceae bacterium]